MSLVFKVEVIETSTGEVLHRHTAPAFQRTFGVVKPLGHEMVEKGTGRVLSGYVVMPGFPPDTKLEG